MATVSFKGTPVHTAGELPKVGKPAPDFELVASDLSTVRLTDFRGQALVISIFPSIDTGVCAQSTRRFNERAGEGAQVLCVSMDLPFAFKRFCAAEGIEHVRSGSAFRSKQFAERYGVRLEDGPLAGLLARAVLVVDADPGMRPADHWRR
jgi:thiol peroxidase